MAKFRKKPVVIEAVQYDGHNYEGEVWPWYKRNGTEHNGIFHPDKDGNIKIGTLEGVMLANPADWIIRGIKGEVYPCKPDIFAATYEPAD